MSESIRSVKDIVVAITGASGVIYGIRLLEALREQDGCRIHFIVSSWAEKTIGIETSYSMSDILRLADISYDYDDLTSAIASGSFRTDAMVIAPCSMKTIGAIANGFSDNLITRSADVMIKEKRKLILVPRETPLSIIHLENMLKLAHVGSVILPPVPGFYAHPKTIEDVIDHTVGKILDQLDLDHRLFRRWKEGETGINNAG